MRTALLYLFLVGLPILGVLAILRVGEGIVPPPAIGGEWMTDSTGAAGQAVVILPCIDGPVRRALHAARLSQSGTTATIALRDASGAAWAEGSLALRPDAGAAEGELSLVGCDGGSVRATLALDGRARPQAATLAVTPVGCAACAPTSVRVRRAGRAGRAAAAGH